MDNASNNDSAMIHLEHIFKRKQIAFNAKKNRIRCFPHIINICVSHIIQSFDKILRPSQFDIQDSESEHSDDDEPVEYKGNETDEEDDDAPVLQEFLDDRHMEGWFRAIKRNPVKMGRKIIHTVCSSGQHRDGFQLSISTGNQSNSFTNENGNPIFVKQLQLLPDVKHRWDSLYVMLGRMRELKPVCLHVLIL